MSKNINIIERIEYDGKNFLALPFTNDHKHAEPCGFCVFGGRCFIGTRDAVVKGVETEIQECGYTCKRPEDFPKSCTCVNREDNTNVYFVAERIFERLGTIRKKSVVTYAFTRERKARKVHRCALCGETIKVGEMYNDLCIRTNKGIQDICTHEHCNFVVTVLDLHLVDNVPDPYYNFDDITHYIAQMYPEGTSIRKEKNLKKIVDKLFSDMNGLIEIPKKSDDNFDCEHDEESEASCQVIDNQ